MSDYISRKAAIDALDEIESEVADGYGYQYEKWRKYFCELPSAQPDVPDTNVGDIISREDAIDAVAEGLKGLKEGYMNNHEKVITRDPDRRHACRM